MIGGGGKLHFSIESATSVKSSKASLTSVGKNVSLPSVDGGPPAEGGGLKGGPGATCPRLAPEEDPILQAYLKAARKGKDTKK